MYLCKIFSVILFFCSTLLFAQKVVLVCDNESKTHIANVNVFTNKYNLITDESGLVEIPKTTDFDSVCFSHIAYQKVCIVYSNIPDTVFLYSKDLITKEITVAANSVSQDNKSIIIDVNKYKKSTFTNVGDLIKAETNLFIKDYGGVSGIKSISMRGLSSENTIVLFNEAAINDIRTGMFDFSLISPLSINKIEVNSNNSGEYGHFGSGGIIKLSSGFNNYDNKLILGVKGNTDFYRSLFFNIKQNSNNFSVAVNFERSYSSNNYKYIFEDFELRRKNSFFSKSFINTNIEYRTNKNVFNFYSHLNYLKNGIPGFVVTNNTQSSFASNSSKMFFTVLNNTHILTDDLLLLTNISYNHQNLLLNDPLKQIFSNKTSQNSILNESSGFIKARYALNNFVLLLGYELNYSTLKNELPTELNSTININRISNKIFGSFNYSIKLEPYLSKFDLSAAVGYDNYSEKLLGNNKNDLFSYQTGISFSLLELPNLNFNASYSKSKRAPSFNEQFYSSLYNIKYLNNEFYEGYDFTINYGYGSKNKFRFSATYYNLISKDKIIWIPTRQALQTPKNYGHIRYNGFEINTNSSFFNDALTFSVFYNYNNALSKSKMFTGDFSYNKQLVYVPKERLSVNGSLNYKNFNFTVYNTFVGERFYSSDNDSKNSLKPYYVCDMSLSYTFNMFNIGNTISLSLFNLFNKSYFVIQSYPMPLRNLSLTYIMEILWEDLFYYH